MFISLLTVCFLALLSCNESREPKVQMGIQPSYFGRVEPQNEWMVYSGTKARVLFEGSCQVSFLLQDSLPEGKEDPDCVYLIIDNDTTKKQLEPGCVKYDAIAFGEGLHCIEIVKLTEAQVGMIKVLSVMISDQGKDFKVLPATYPKRRTIEYIGNSITCGYGNEDSTNTVGFHAIHENVMKTYGALTAAHYEADACFIAYSGRGLVRNYDGSRKNLVPDFYDRWVPDNATKQMSVDAYLPADLLVVNVGTNDLNSEVTTGSSLDSLEFVTRYVEFLGHLRKIHTKSPIICTVGPMLTDAYPENARFLSRCQNYVRQAVQSVNQVGDSIVYFYNFTPQTEPFGEDYHPSIKTHRQMADELISCIDSLHVWDEKKNERFFYVKSQM